MGHRLTQLRCDCFPGEASQEPLNFEGGSVPFSESANACTSACPLDLLAAAAEQSVSMELGGSENRGEFNVSR